MSARLKSVESLPLVSSRRVTSSSKEPQIGLTLLSVRFRGGGRKSRKKPVKSNNSTFTFGNYIKSVVTSVNTSKGSIIDFLLNKKNQGHNKDVDFLMSQRFSPIVSQKSSNSLGEKVKSEILNELKDVKNGEFIGQVASNLKQFIDEFALATHDKYRISVIQLLRQQMIINLRNLEKSVNNFSNTVDQVIAPDFNKLYPLLLKLYRKEIKLPWTDSLVNKFKVDTKSFDSQCKYFLKLQYNYYQSHFKSLTLETKPLTISFKDPTKWYPLARKLKRKIIMHVGPTNSGKTYNALKRLKESNSGYFAGPLRLLAREVYDRFQQEGVRCNLITGEEIIEDLDESTKLRSKISSGTIEMISLTEDYDVVILDEIQMICDKYRGRAWTEALLGVKAKELHLCGEESAVPLVHKLIEFTGDEIEIHRYKRLGKLEVEPNTLNEFQKGDCVVSFSKHNVLSLKMKIEQETNFKASVIYGALPAETRITQAKAFNSGETDILIATDAIGMGLNLNINRIIFTKTSKFNGKETTTLTTSQIKQIAGRAGRFKVPNYKEAKTKEPVFDVLQSEKDEEKKASTGYVTCLKRSQRRIIETALSQPFGVISKASLKPPDYIWNDYLQQFGQNAKFSDILNVYLKELNSTNDLFFPCDLESETEAAQVFDTYDNNYKQIFEKNKDSNLKPLTLKDKTILSGLPVGRIDERTINVLLEFCRTIANGDTTFIFDLDLPFELIFNTPKNLTFDPNSNIEKSIFFNSKKIVDTHDRIPSTLKDYLAGLEFFHQILLCFSWLSYRYPKYFVDIQSVKQLKYLCEHKITQSLQMVDSDVNFNQR